jgi:DNA polymerase-3 subunit alpha
MYLSGHPLESVEKELKKLKVVKYKEISATKKDQKVFVAGLVISIRTLVTKNGDRMAIVMLDDRFDRFEVTFFPDPYQKYRDLLLKDQLIIIEGLAGVDNYSGGLKIKTQSVYTLAMARETFAKNIKIKLHSTPTQDFIQNLKEILSIQERGECPIYIEYQNQHANAQIKLDPKWNIKASDSSLRQIFQTLPCAVELEY